MISADPDEIRAAVAARYAGLASKPSIHTYFTGHGRHLVRKHRQGINHFVNSVSQLGNFPAGYNG